MKTVKITSDELKTLELVSKAVSSEKYRPGLCNVNVENGVVVGCNGHILRVERIESLVGVNGQIKVEAIKTAKKAIGKAVTVGIDVETENLEVYPKWQNVLAGYDAYVNEVSPWFLKSTMEKLLSSLPGKICNVRFMAQEKGKEKSVLVVYTENGKMKAAGVIMPTRLLDVEDLVSGSPCFLK